MSDPLSRAQLDDEPYQMPEGLAPTFGSEGVDATSPRRWPEWAYMPDQPDRWAVFVAVGIVMLGIVLGFIYVGV